VTADRKVLYIAPSPKVSREVSFMHEWSIPQVEEGRRDSVPIPQIQAIVDYLAAFYHGLPVRLLPASMLQFTSWKVVPSRKKAKKVSAEPPQYVGLTALKDCVRIRTRASVDKLYPRQLNLDDLLDTAIGMLPEDAFALLMIVNHDLFEDDEDTFVCGRAYVGSRVAVVSTARYNPILDSIQSVEQDHAWPASHCKTYMDACCASASKGGIKGRVQSLGSLAAAISAFRDVPDLMTP
jgi:archaemetzincin